MDRSMKITLFMLTSLLTLPLLACGNVGDVPGPGCSSTQTSTKIAFSPPMTEGSGQFTQCLEQVPGLSTDGTAESVAFHVTQAPSNTCACPAAQGLQPVSAERQSAADKFFNSQTGTIAKASCVCEVKQLTASDGAALTACKQEIKNPVLDSAGQPVNGYCYVDADDASSNPEIVGHCSSFQKRAIRFVGRPATQEADDILVFLILNVGCTGLE
jgi:Tfp pilus assembly protein PilW